MKKSPCSGGKEGNKMIAVFLAGTTAICGAGWLICWVASAALAKYMTDKGYKLPSNNEMKNCCNYVWEHLFHIK